VNHTIACTQIWGKNLDYNQICFGLFLTPHIPHPSLRTISFPKTLTHGSFIFILCLVWDKVPWYCDRQWAYKGIEKCDEKLHIEAITCIWFEYLEIILTNQNWMHAEIQRILNLENFCYELLKNLASSPLLSKNVNIKIHISINLHVILFGFETCYSY
jgi:hypothetical protein